MPRILPLPPHVVDKIAAGEVIQRPFSAIKELIENSVDAGATQVGVTVKGLSTMLQVQDNGHGIHPEDLVVLCKRFNTSKLRNFDDLRAMTTYGFRGEALASMTHVARVTVTSQKPGQSCSYRAQYKDGGIVGKPSKCAGVPGTTITVEDLFYNVPQRLRALKSAGEEYNKILDVVQKYAVHHSGRVGFTVKRANVHAPDLHTVCGTTVKDTVGKIYGTEVARELIALNCDVPESEEGAEPIFTKLSGFVTNPNFSRKKGEFLLFINGRLVDSTALKRVIDNCYVECLPKGGHPFVYLSLDLPLQNVDVNVHPTKKEVQFLHEDEIATAIESSLKKVLLGGNESRAFTVNKLKPTLAATTMMPSEDNIVPISRGAFSKPQANQNEENAKEEREEALEVDVTEVDLSEPINDDTEAALSQKIYSLRDHLRRDGDEKEAEIQESHQEEIRPVGKLSNPFSAAAEPLPRKKVRADNKLIRTDAQVGSGIERFVMATPRSDAEVPVKLSSDPVAYVLKDESLEDAPLLVTGSDALELESVKKLQSRIRERQSIQMTNSIKGSVFVGVVDQTFSLIQCGTSLVAINHILFGQELCYQRVLSLFGRFRLISLSPAFPILDLLQGDGKACSTLMEKAELLYEYFGVDFRDGHLRSLPRLFADHLPQQWALPALLRSLLTKVHWSDEVQCFKTIAEQIAHCYSELPIFKPLILTSPDSNLGVQLGDKNSLQYAIKNILYPNLKAYLAVPMEFSDSRKKLFVQLAKLEQMYRVFERC